MKIIKELVLLFILAFILTSCNTTLPSNPSNSLPVTTVKTDEELSPFIQFQKLKRGEMGFDSEQVDNVLRLYGIYDRILEKVPNEVYRDSLCRDVIINGYNIGNKNIAVLQVNKGHLYICIMFSKINHKWAVEGFVYINGREKPEYRVEQSGDGRRYWLVVKQEANRGTGLNIYDEIWYNPDGSVAAEYPIEGSTLFLPENVEPGANTNFFASVDYDGDSKISLSYSISFLYDCKDNLQDDSFYRFQSKYSPVIRDYWEYDLKTRQFKFMSSYPALPKSFNTMKHVSSNEYGILQGYIDFYRTQIGNKKITTLAQWEKFMEVKK